MKTLYFDCFSGISGDMTIGALLDLGLDFDYLKAELKKLPVEGYELRASRVVRANVSAMKFDVLMEGDHNHPQAHEHPHEHHHHGHGQFHRKASEILAMIRESRLNPNTKRIATNIFTKLAISEGNVHHIPPEDVEFHEVGAVDSIVDTAGSAIGFDALGIERFLCSAINIGSGFIHCQHGIFPVPAPATADLLGRQRSTPNTPTPNWSRPLALRSWLQWWTASNPFRVSPRTASATVRARSNSRTSPIACG